MNNSSPQLCLRILSGKHAGGEIPLDAKDFNIGSNLDCDIVISDWPRERNQASFMSAKDGLLQVSLDSTENPTGFGINHPVREGKIAIVLLNQRARGDQPSDLDFLSQLLRPTPVVSSEPGSATIGKWLIAVTIMTAVLSGAIALQGPRLAAANRPPEPLNSIVKVRDMLKAQRHTGVRAVVEGNAIVVEGLVKNKSEKEALAEQLTALNLEMVHHRYALESDIEGAIKDAIAQPGATVHHVGKGVFEIRGVESEETKKKIDLSRLRNDLGTVVNTIIFAGAKDMPFSDPDVNLVQKSKGYQFRLAEDGVKYFMPR